MSRYSHTFSALAALAAGALLSSCGGGDSSSTTASNSAALTDAPVKGVCYLAQPSGLFGATDAAGTYKFQSGDSVTFWIDTSGAGCTSTAATSLSTTGINLGVVVPSSSVTGTTQQTFVLSLSAGPQVAEALQALNHGSTSAMDVSGITLANTGSVVTNINSYISSGGATQSTPSAVGSLFQGAQTAATLGGSTITPALPITNVNNFQTAVVNALSNTISGGGLGTAPTTITIPAGRLLYAVTSGTYTRNAPNGFGGNTSGATATSGATPFTDGHIVYHSGNGSPTTGIKIRPTQGSTSVNPFSAASVSTTGANITNYTGVGGVLETAEELPFTYSVSGNVVNKTVTLKSVGNGTVGTQSDATTIVYDDGHGAFYSGTSTKTYTAGSNSGATDTVSYSGSNIRLTPLTLSMLAGHTLTISAPACPNGQSTFTFNASGTLSTNSNCGGEIANWAATANVPGILLRTSPRSTGTMNDGSILYVGLNGPSVTAGASLVFVTANNGYAQSNSANYPAWGSMQVLSVQ